MKRRLMILGVVVMIAAIAAIPAYANRGDGALGTIYVTGQGLYYDTFVTVDPLPPVGRFQKLEPTTVEGATGQTPYGPGDQGYVGGRWWKDVNGNNIMDEGDMYLLCPLLGPGRTSP